MSTSERGFSLVEVLLALVLVLLLTLAVTPVWVGLQSASSVAADRATAVAQSRVATARLERDLRTAVAEPLGRMGGASILRATPTETIILVRHGTSVEVVEWEIAGSALMRRRGPWLDRDPAVVSHAWYVDHKTLLTGVSAETAFSYLVPVGECDTVAQGPDLSDIAVVRLRGVIRAAGAAVGDGVALRVWGRVGR